MSAQRLFSIALLQNSLFLPLIPLYIKRSTLWCIKNLNFSTKTSLSYVASGKSCKKIVIKNLALPQEFHIVWDNKFLLEIATSKQIQKGKLKPLHQRRKKKFDLNSILLLLFIFEETKQVVIIIRTV